MLIPGFHDTVALSESTSFLTSLHIRDASLSQPIIFCRVCYQQRGGHGSNFARVASCWLSASAATTTAATTAATATEKKKWTSSNDATHVDDDDECVVNLVGFSTRVERLSPIVDCWMICGRGSHVRHRCSCIYFSNNPLRVVPSRETVAVGTKQMWPLEPLNLLTVWLVNGNEPECGSRRNDSGRKAKRGSTVSLMCPTHIK